MSIGVGLIGCGGMGSWHAGNLLSQPGIDVVAVADPVATAAERVATATGARVLDGLDVIAADGVDAVLIASSDESHAELTIAAIAERKPCLCEKPLGANLDDARAVLDAEVAAGRRLVRLGFMREHDPAHAQLVASLDGLGPITRVRCVHRNVDERPRDASLLFAQSIIHDIHTIRWLTGQEFARVTVYVVPRSDGFRDVLLVGELTDGALGSVDFEDRAFAYEVQVEVTAEGGMLATLPHPRAVARVAAEERLRIGTDWFGRFEDAYRIEIDDWAASLREGSFRGPTAWDGFAAQVVADAGERAMRSGSPVDVTLPARPSLYGGSS